MKLETAVVTTISNEWIKFACRPTHLAHTSRLKRLFQTSSGLIHSVDPFKVEQQEALRKAKLLQSLGSPFLLLASTDFDYSFNLEKYIQPLKEASLPILSHFPPKPRLGYPVVRAADGILLTSIANSLARYYRETKGDRQAMLETIPHLSLTQLNLSVVAFTFGEDEKSRRAVATDGLPYSVHALKRTLQSVDFRGVNAVYLFSRNKRLPSNICEAARSICPKHCKLIASGKIYNFQHYESMRKAGADYVVVGSALECEDWETRLRNEFFKRLF